MTKDLLKSFAIHSLLLLLMFKFEGGSGGSFQTPDGEKSEQEQQSAPEHQELNVQIVDPPSEKTSEIHLSDGTEITKKAPHANDSCERFYGGIGVTQSAASYPMGPNNNIVVCTVTEVHTGYPAYKAGIKEGDILLNFEEVRGEIGTPVTVLTRRDGRQITYHLIRDKICIDDPNQGEP